MIIKCSGSAGGSALIGGPTTISPDSIQSKVWDKSLQKQHHDRNLRFDAKFEVEQLKQRVDDLTYSLYALMEVLDEEKNNYKKEQNNA